MKKRRPFLNKSLDEIASSGDDAIIGGGSETARKLAELQGDLSVTLIENLYALVYVNPVGMKFTLRFDHYPSPSEVWEFITTRVLLLNNMEEI